MTTAERSLLFVLAGTVQAMLEEQRAQPLVDVIDDLVKQVAAELPADEPDPDPAVTLRLRAMLRTA